jgi:hypothetical protein
MLRNISSAASNRKEKMEKALKLKTPSKSNDEDEESKNGDQYKVRNFMTELYANDEFLKIKEE